eukprot:gene310-782_t
MTVAALKYPDLGILLTHFADPVSVRDQYRILRFGIQANAICEEKKIAVIRTNKT